MSDLKYNIVGFYGYPSDYSTAQRNRLISRVKESLKVDEINILMGDFNFVEESIDRNNHKPDCLVTAKDSLVINEWKAVKNTFDLNDTFRNTNPQIRRYSYVAKNKKSKSRIDRIYISGSEAGKVLKQNFKETPWDDHKIVVVELSQSIERGPGQWALNTDLLRDTNFLTEVEKQWSRFSELKNDFTSKVEWWDRAKAMVKTIAMIFSIHEKQIETELEKP